MIRLAADKPAGPAGTKPGGGANTKPGGAAGTKPGPASPIKPTKTAYTSLPLVYEQGRYRYLRGAA